MTEAYLLGGIRTPFARYGGSLSHLRVDDLLGVAHPRSEICRGSDKSGPSRPRPSAALSPAIRVTSIASVIEFRRGAVHSMRRNHSLRWRGFENNDHRGQKQAFCLIDFHQRFRGAMPDLQRWTDR